MATEAPANTPSVVGLSDETRLVDTEPVTVIGLLPASCDGGSAGSADGDGDDVAGAGVAAEERSEEMRTGDAHAAVQSKASRTVTRIAGGQRPSRCVLMPC